MGTRFMHLNEIAALIGLSLEHKEAREALEKFNLSASIPAGDETQGPLRYLSSRDKGIQILFDENEIIKGIFLFGVSRFGVSLFQDEIYPGITLSSSRESVIAALGTPAESGSDFHDFLSSTPGRWDKYILGPASVHFQYSDKEGSIELITIVKREEY